MKVTNKVQPLLYVLTKGTWGGAQRYVFDLCVYAKEQGLEPVLAYGESGLLVERLTRIGVRCIRVPGLARDISLVSDIRAFFSLAALFLKEHPKVVHLNSSKASALGALAAKITNVPHTVFTAHGWAFTEKRSLLAKVFFYLVHAVTLILADTTIAVSEAIMKSAPLRPLVRHKLMVIRNGIAHTPSSYSKAAARTVLIARFPFLSKVQQELWVVTLGELHDNKGIDIGIEAWKNVAHKDAQWCIIGGGERESRLKTQAEDVPSIHFLGFIENAAELLPAFDCMLLPSRTEALAYVLLEAGVAHLPVIATNVGGVPEIVRNDVSGILIEKENPRSCEQALRTLLSDEEKRASFGASLHAHVTKHFSLTRMCEATLACYGTKPH